MVGVLHKKQSGEWEIVDKFDNRVTLKRGDPLLVQVDDVWHFCSILVTPSETYQFASKNGLTLYEGQPAMNVDWICT